MNRSFLLKVSAYLAIVFAPFLAIVETVHNWGDWSDPAFWIIDYVAAALVFAGGMDWLRENKKDKNSYITRCVALLTGGWGFACAMSWMAFFLYLQSYQLNPETIDLTVFMFAGGLFLWTIIGFLLSLTVIITSEKSDLE